MFISFAHLVCLLVNLCSESSVYRCLRCRHNQEITMARLLQPHPLFIPKRVLNGVAVSRTASMDSHSRPACPKARRLSSQLLLERTVIQTTPVLSTNSYF